MAAEDAAPAVEVEVEAEAAATAALAPTRPPLGPEAYVYDDSLLIKVKGKVKRPAKPDDAERTLQVQKLQAEINKYSERIKEIKEIIDSKRNSAKGVGSASKDIRSRLQALRDEKGTILVGGCSLPDQPPAGGCLWGGQRL